MTNNNNTIWYLFGIWLSIMGGISFLQQNFLGGLAIIPIIIICLFSRAQKNANDAEFIFKNFRVKQIDIKILLILTFLMSFLTIYYYVESSNIVMIIFYSFLLDIYYSFVSLFGILLGWEFWIAYGEKKEILKGYETLYKEAYEREIKEKKSTALIFLGLSVFWFLALYLENGESVPGENVLTNPNVITFTWLLFSGCAILNYVTFYNIEERRKKREVVMK